MSEQCTDISQNITKLSFPGENLGFTTEIDGRENKEDFLTFPFDHMYACNSDNSDVNSERQAGESEVRHLRDLLMLHLDLIQQQSDEIVNKDKYIAELKLENDTLKQRLERMERRVTLQKNCSSNYNNSNSSFSLETFTNDMTHDTGFCGDTEESKDNLKVMGLCGEDSNYNPIVSNVDRRSTDRDLSANLTEQSEQYYNNKLKNKQLSDTSLNCKLKEEPVPPVSSKGEGRELTDIFPDSTTVGNIISNSPSEMPENHVNMNVKDTRHFGLRPTSRRKRLCSNSSQLSTNESLTSAPDERRKSTDHRKKRKNPLKNNCILTTDAPYITQAGDPSACDDQDDDIDVNRTTTLEVPRWRVKMYTSCYSMEGTENLDDEVYNKRHLRLENDERRRKRWDVQRIREQRHVERLKQRQERVGSGTKSDDSQNEPLATFWPSLEDLRFIEVTDELPVSAFGSPIPKLTPSEFQLPWINGMVPTKKPRMRKSTARQKSQKR